MAVLADQSIITSYRTKLKRLLVISDLHRNGYFSTKNSILWKTQKKCSSSGNVKSDCIYPIRFYSIKNRTLKRLIAYDTLEQLRL